MPLHVAESRGRRALPAVGAFVALLVTVSGCGGESGGDRTKNTSPDSPIAPASASLTAGMALPAEAYLYSPSDIALLTRALNTLTSDCMKQAGFTYKADYKQPPPINFMDRRYGIANSHTAAAYGYHFPMPEVEKSKASTLSAAGRLALTGGPGGDGAQEGGCVGKSKAKLAQGGTFGPEEPARKLNLESFGKSQKDPRVLAAFRQWSACMAGRGYRYASPMDAIDDTKFSKASNRTAEVSTAQADVECKKKTGLVRAWFDVETEMQKAVINQSPERFAQLQERKKAQLERAAAAVGESR